ncbi:MAG: hypothetical protein HYV02_01210 [Deltaproteobacteria bacterium]|nr:hypothetical protein [Deltaproteobacteria bacterium]
MTVYHDPFRPEEACLEQNSEVSTLGYAVGVAFFGAGLWVFNVV